MLRQALVCLLLLSLFVQLSGRHWLLHSDNAGITVEHQHQTSVTLSWYDLLHFLGKAHLHHADAQQISLENSAEARWHVFADLCHSAQLLWQTVPEVALDLRPDLVLITFSGWWPRSPQNLLWRPPRP